MNDLPTPYYQDDAVTLYHGDCREVVPLLGRFDLLLTDPPYGIGEDGGDKSRRRGYGVKVNHERLGWDKERADAQLISMLIASSDNAIVWGGNYYADILPPSMGWLYWDKRIGGDFSDGELAWTSYKRAVRDFSKSSFAGLRGGHDRKHPTQKPTALMLWCISLAGESIRSILDPFAGSGTTGRAAKDMGRKCTLIEREERYCEIAAKRMCQEVLAL